MTDQVVRITAFGCFILLLFLQMRIANPFPYADEWHLIPYAIDTQKISWGWLFEQHVDHRIPLQKLIQVLLLHFGALDCRVLVFANGVFAYLLTYLLINSVRVYRGSSSIGDLLFPLIIMNPGFPPFLWGFHFQFMSSVILLFLILMLLLKKSDHDVKINLLAAGSCLLLLAACGMNGVILSGLMSLIVLIYLYMARPVPFGSVWFRAILASIVLSLAAVTAVLLLWQPSDASGIARDIDIGDQINNIVHAWFLLVSPRSWRLPPVGPIAYYWLNTLTYSVALLTIVRKLWRDHRQAVAIGPGKVILAGAMGATLALQLSIASGRAAYWSPGLEMHYGYIAVILVLTAWIIISTELPVIFMTPLMLVLLFVYTTMYIANVKLTMNDRFHEQNDKTVQVHADLSNNLSLNHFTEKNILFFFHVDNPETRALVQERLAMMRAAGIHPYTLLHD